MHECKNDMRKMWSTINKVTGRAKKKHDISDTFLVNGQKITDRKNIANGFCRYFTGIGEQLAAEIPPPTHSPEHYLGMQRHDRSIFMSPTDHQEIEKIVSKLKGKKSCGHDQISSSFIKHVIHNISIPLASIINKSLESGKVPHTFKLAKVIPIYKKKEHNLFSNHRPISLLPSFSKILEKVVHYRVYKFLDKHNIFCPSQYGFRQNHSTVDAVTELIFNITKSMDNKEVACSVFLDLSKAFDTINHKTLLRKLEFYGIRGIALEWFRDYLTNRKQFVCYKDYNSDVLPLTCGFPQGSVLGPLLFIIYINDLPNCLKYCKCVLFADDTTVYLSSNNRNDLRTRINSDLSNLGEWFRSNKLSLNVEKTEYMVFETKQGNYDFPITIANKQIHATDHVRFLGIILDNKLTWERHITHCRNKITGGTYALRSSKSILNVPHLRIIYNSLIDSYLNYGLLLWGSALRKYIKPLEIQQNKAIRAVINAHYTASACPLYKALKLLPLMSKYKLNMGKFMYKYHAQNLPSPLQCRFITNAAVHDHNTRTRHHPHIIMHQTSRSTNSFIHQAPHLWYGTNDSIKTARSLKQFTSRYKKQLISEL